MLTRLAIFHGRVRDGKRAEASLARPYAPGLPARPGEEEPVLTISVFARSDSDRANTLDVGSALRGASRAWAWRSTWKHLQSIWMWTFCVHHSSDLFLYFLAKANRSRRSSSVSTGLQRRF